jgi:hypothetical protein
MSCRFEVFSVVFIFLKNYSSIYDHMINKAVDVLNQIVNRHSNDPFLLSPSLHYFLVRH